MRRSLDGSSCKGFESIKYYFLDWYIWIDFDRDSSYNWKATGTSGIYRNNDLGCFHGGNNPFQPQKN